MRSVAAVPALGILTGAAVGLLFSRPPFVLAYVLITTSVAGALWAWTLRRPLWLALSVGLGFFAGGVLLSAVEWQRAWRPSLRVVFEELAREGRRLPEDDEAFAVVEGILRADASLGASGVSLSVEIDGLVGQVGQVGQVGRVGRDRKEREGFSRASGGILVTVVGSLAPTQMGEWRAGRRVRFPVQLRRPSRYLDPGVADHERALARRGTTLVGTVKSGALVDVVQRGTWFDEAMAKARAFARRAIAGAVGRWSPESAGIVAAIVIGDRAGLGDDMERRLQEAGTYHVIAISGGNIAILAGLLLGVFRLAGRLGRTAMIASMAVLIVYARLVGNGASVDRATLMAVVYFGARAFDQRSPPLNALALVAAILAAWDPLAVADPAFILTFGATLAILLVVPASPSPGPGRGPQRGSRVGVEGRGPQRGSRVGVEGRGPQRGSRVGVEGRGPQRGSRVGVEGRGPQRGSRVGVEGRVEGRIAAALSIIRAMFAASAAAETLLFPVGALAFSRVTFAGLGLNFLAIPLMGVAQIAGMAVVPAAIVFEPLAAMAGWVAHIGAAGLVQSADLVRFAPALTWRVAPPSWVAIGAYYGAGGACWALWRRRHAGTASHEPDWARAIRRTAGGVAAAAAVWILVNPATLVAARGDGALHVTFIDVGQGDATFVVFPRGETMLVDAGGLSASSSFDIGDRVVAPVIRQAGFRRIDYLALTHGDPDHIGGAGSIRDEFRPREVWEGIPVPRFEPLAALRLATQAAGARWANVYTGDRLVVDGVEVVARHPRAADWERQKVRNDDSMVLELRWRNLSVLLTGDIGRAVEREIGPAIPAARVRVLKVPHHGSLTSSAPEFVKAVRPQIAVVSAGRSNHFGHPVPEVLERYTAIGAEIFRTDRDGAVTVDSDGYSIEVRTFTGRRLSLH